MKYIQLGGKRSNGSVALVSDEDFALISQFTWTLGARGYPTAGGLLTMHRFVMGVPPAGMVTDHIDRDKLNNQRSNLRFCTKSQNSFNTNMHPKNKSGHRGVSWSKIGHKWQAHLVFEGKKQYLGLYDDVEEAAKAYQDAYKKAAQAITA